MRRRFPKTGPGFPKTALGFLLFAGLFPTPGAAQEAVAEFGDPAGATRLVIHGSTDIDAFAPLLEAFATTALGLAIHYEQWASNDLYEVSAAACAGEEPGADMVISSAVDLQVKLVNDGCALAYSSGLTDRLPPDLNWRDQLFGVTREPAVIVYNRALVPPDQAPASRFDLIDLLRPADSIFAGRIATYDIEASGLGYLFAFADAHEATTFGALLEAFGRSDIHTSCCSGELIDGVAEGRFLIAYNVLGSYALARAARDPDIAVVAPSDYTLVLSRAAMIPRRAANPEAAAAFLDFMLSNAGRNALQQARLMVSIGDAEGSELETPGGAASLLRPIPLSPVLLVGLDRHKRALFIARWRAVLASRP